MLVFTLPGRPVMALNMLTSAHKLPNSRRAEAR